MKPIALLTDFGKQDHYVGVMKGVILNISPEARWIDVSHDVPGQDIFHAAFLLKNSYSFFPRNTVFLVVVDPGVGSERKPILVRSKDYYFIGPDNGVLSLAAQDNGIRKIIWIKNRQLALHPVSRTFHGRDIFAPAAAWVSKGGPLRRLGPVLNDMSLLDFALPAVKPDAIKGKVVYIDGFGNLVTNIAEETLNSWKKKNDVQIKIKNVRIRGLSRVYQDVREGEICSVIGSSEFLEISVRGGDARNYLRAATGTAVTVRLRS